MRPRICFALHSTIFLSVGECSEHSPTKHEMRLPVNDQGKGLSNSSKKWRNFMTIRPASNCTTQVGRFNAPPPISSQHDAAWIDTYRNEISFDPLWMLTPAHFAAGSGEQEEWNRLFPLRGDSGIQRTLEAMLVRSRHRELLASIAEQRNPHFSYPAIPLAEV